MGILHIVFKFESHLNPSSFACSFKPGAEQPVCALLYFMFILLPKMFVFLENARLKIANPPGYGEFKVSASPLLHALIQKTLQEVKPTPVCPVKVLIPQSTVFSRL